MNGPTGKYRGLSRDPIDGVPLTTRAHPDGFPTRVEHTRGPYLEKERRAAASEVLYARSEFFTLPADNEKYVKVLDWIANGQAILRFERTEWIPDDKSWRVWITYLDIRGYVPTDEEFSAQVGGPFDRSALRGLMK